MSIRTIILALGATVGLAACGNTIAEQGIGGAAVGAGTAAITGGSLAQGAAIGAAANVGYCQLNPGRC